MTNLVITHKKQLLFAVTICLFSILAISSGRIFLNLLETKDSLNREKQLWTKISKNIRSDLAQSQQKEWSVFAANNPKIFLQANTIKYNKTNSAQFNSATENIITDSFTTILANIVVSTRKHIKKTVKY
jgi:hypothetical protein